MVEISEIPGDGSNGGDPNDDSNAGDRKRKPQEESNQNKKRKLELPLCQELVEDLIVKILACIPRDRYPKLYVASKAFSETITSERLFMVRSQLGKTERLLYTFIGSHRVNSSPRWYLLHRINNTLGLGMIGTLPSMVHGSAVVTIGHEMYIIGGMLSSYAPVKTLYLIDCRFHTLTRLQNMQRARHRPAAGVIGGKIYVIGGFVPKNDDGDLVEVFNVSEKSWEDNVPGPNPNDASLDGMVDACVVMQEKVYILSCLTCYTYEPIQNRWESLGVGTPLSRYLRVSCVINDTLYAFHTTGHQIVLYNLEEAEWKPVNGVGVPLHHLDQRESKMANLGGKLVILGRSLRPNSRENLSQERDIWCIVVALGRGENGEIFGSVESNSRVLSCSELPFIEHSETVTV